MNYKLTKAFPDNMIEPCQEKLKFALIGCGAVADHVHLPVVAMSERAKITVLVDKSSLRARQLAEKYGVPETVDDHRKIIGKVDAALVAVPHHLHAPITIDLLQHGIHVLVEKPMALKTKDCDDMIKTAKNAGAVLAVGLARRFYPSSQFVKNMLDRKLLGEIISYDFNEGAIYNWPVATDFMLRKETGGGVLADTGAHALDTLLWWLGDYESVDYYDDAMGGVEADCEIHLSLKSGAKGVIRLSRIRDLRNSYILRGEKATLEIESNFNPEIDLKFGGQEFSLSGR
ncbi:MAG: Gfo/Idh/MocA family oxidoreductase, partial [Calditrichaeota bacterium]|nr:Gfo/Idh/MocA family oxidoreductase [Calditrichota bacterium]